jgi:hypothetical protein
MDWLTTKDLLTTVGSVLGTLAFVQGFLKPMSIHNSSMSKEISEKFPIDDLWQHLETYKSKEYLDIRLVQQMKELYTDRSQHPSRYRFKHLLINWSWLWFQVVARDFYLLLLEFERGWYYTHITIHYPLFDREKAEDNFTYVGSIQMDTPEGEAYRESQLDQLEKKHQQSRERSMRYVQERLEDIVVTLDALHRSNSKEVFEYFLPWKWTVFRVLALRNRSIF